jgi:DNA modification methylase
MGVKGSKSTFNSDAPANSPKISDSEIIAVSDKAATVMEQEIRKTLSALISRPTVAEIQDIVEAAILSCAESVSARSINIYQNEKSIASLCVPNYVTFNSKAGSRLHPTEKPVPLLKYLTELFSNPGDVVLDPFAGSASMGETAIATGRRAVLVEKDKEFFDKGSARIKKIMEANDSNQLILE